MKFSKISEIKKKVLVVFDLFTMDENVVDLVKENENEYVLDFPNLLSFYDDSEKNIDTWIKNCRVYLGELAKKYDEVNLLGYSLGAILAGNCTTLPFVQKVILIELSYWYMEYQGEKKAFYSDKVNKILTNENINASLFSIIYTKLINEFDGQIKQADAEMLILQKLDDYSIESKMMNRLYRYLNKQKAKLVQIGTEEQDLLTDEKTRNMMKLLINNFLDN
ncbi:hypothetical protein [Anaerorhabdus sp.]|uniref:hypothetical protein n=1 Tax=Anaerorhabdus sp. TaxID=1872524 RepID=UPI002B1FBC23|nr:hypothetical protein [Anaerorhabdus sp.]MEA4875808.1 hypothetical protein [Anaerorhabdus sp.]